MNSLRRRDGMGDFFAEGGAVQLSGRGVALSLAASVLFVLIPGYVVQLAPLDGWQVFAQRILWTIPAAFVLLLLTRQLPAFFCALARLRREPRLMLALLASAALMGVQWWLFVWAPLAGRMLEISLGYFLLPLAMVLVGRLFYGERLSRLQRLAVALAVLGVLHELWRTQAFSWVTLVAALGYPPYFMLRRWMRLDALSGFVLEVLLLAPIGIWLIASAGLSDLFTQAPQLLWWLPGLGLLSALAFGAMLAASRLLPLGLFGILSYVEPVLLFGIAVLLFGEAFSAAQLWTYGPIWLAISLIVFDSVRLLRAQALRSID